MSLIFLDHTSKSIQENTTNIKNNFIVTIVIFMKLLLITGYEVLRQPLKKDLSS